MQQFICKFYLFFQNAADSQTVYRTLFDYIYHTKCLYPFICLYLHQFCVRYFTSMSIADWLLGHSITVTVTTHADRKGIHSEMKMVAGREPKSTKWCYNEKKMLISWADKKSKQKDPKLILLVSTVHDQMKVSKD